MGQNVFRNGVSRPEKYVGELIDELGYNYNHHRYIDHREVDYYISDLGLAIFVDGCYYHACSKCGHGSNKYSYIIENDAELFNRLIDMGCKVIRYWEHSVWDNNFNIRLESDLLEV